MIVIAATMDTKGEHVDYLRNEIERRGGSVAVVDCGTRPATVGRIDVDSTTIARLGGSSIEAVMAFTDRTPALAVMTDGLAAYLDDAVRNQTISGFVSLGGGTNASLAARAFRCLPYGLPKMLVSTSVSGDTERFIGGRDAILMQPVVDFFGLNSALRATLARAGAAMAAAAEIPFWDNQTRPVIGVSSIGATSEAVEAIEDILRAADFETMMFHARGSGGQALEDLIADGRFSAVLDLATTEIADEVVGGLRSAGPDRLEAAGRQGIPQVVVPGGIDVVNYSLPETVPDRYRGRTLIRHAPTATLLRTTADECLAIGRWMGEKLTMAEGPTMVLIPERGFSSYDAPGRPYEDPEARVTFESGLRDALASRPDITIEKIDAHINDPSFAETACARLRELMSVQIR